MPELISPHLEHQQANGLLQTSLVQSSLDAQISIYQTKVSSYFVLCTSLDHIKVVAYEGSKKELHSWSQTPPTSCVTLGRLLSLSELQLPYL